MTRKIIIIKNKRGSVLAGSWFNVGELKLCNIGDRIHGACQEPNPVIPVASVHTSHRGTRTPSSRPSLWQVRRGMYGAGGMWFRFCASSNGKEVRFCLPILSAWNTSAAVSLEFVYSEIWEEQCLDKRMVC